MMTESKFDIILTQAFQEYVDEKLESDLCNNKEFKTSAKFEKEIQRMIKSKQNVYYKLTLTRGRRLLCACIMIIILLISLFSVEAVRNFVGNFFVEHFSGHNYIVSADNSKDNVYPTKIETLYELGYIPDGYILSDKNIIANNASYIYVGNNNAILFMQQTKEGWGKSLDNEHSKSTIEFIDGQDYYINYSDELGSTILWDNGEYVFTLSAELPKETMLDMCKSLKIKE